jgi:quinol monooxygenase YgiN
MRLFMQFVLAAILMSVAPEAARAQAVGDSSIQVVTYVEAVPSATQQVVTLLKQLADASRKQAGVVRFEVIQRTAPTSHFAIIEAWRDQQAYDMQTASAHSQAFRGQSASLLTAPPDERLCVSVSVGSAAPAQSAGATYVISHVDIVGPNPANRDAFVPILAALAETGRKEPGNQRFDILVQKARLNHFQVVEVWNDQQAHDVHELTANVKAFRVKLHPASGALYDQRWYRGL